ncbi:MAG: RDD family protein [Egibacteraceae bacterium]
MSAVYDHGQAVERGPTQEPLIAQPSTRLASWAVEFVLAIVTLGFGWLVWAAMAAGKGQTPAKQVIGLQVVDAQTNEPVGFGKMFWVRGILGLIVASIAFGITFGVLLLMPLWDRQNRTIYEALSGTLVVRTNKSKT